jgi:hypothetical protein
MRMAALIAKQATMIEVRRRRDPEAIGELVGFLESSWAKCFGDSPPPPKKEKD